MPNSDVTHAIMATRRKILSTTHAILALTWFCHLSMYLWSLGGGAWGAPRGDPPYTWKKLQCLKMIFRPFGAKKNKKNWIWKMTLAETLETSITFATQKVRELNLQQYSSQHTIWTKWLWQWGWSERHCNQLTTDVRTCLRPYLYQDYFRNI